MIIHKEYGDRNSIIEFSPENHNKLKEFIQEMDHRHGFDLSQRYSSSNSYDCDDYLYVAWLMNKVVQSYNRMNYIPEAAAWRPGYRAVPYIHIELFEGNAMTLIDGIWEPNDKGLEVKVGPTQNGCYVLKMDRNYLLRYILFLSGIFDQNAELFTDLDNQELTLGDGSKRIANEVLDPGPLVTKNDILKLAQDLFVQRLTEPATALRNYAETLSEDARVPMPAITFLNKEFVGLNFIDIQRTGFSVPLKKTIFNTSGFAKYFDTRCELIEELFEESFLAIFSHEFSHVANGHCLLGITDPGYANQKHIRICAEQNADDTAIRLRLSDPLFEGKDGEPHSNELSVTAEQLIHTWAVRSFSMHLGLSWMYRGEDRTWSDGTLDAYINDRNVLHPLYQFRTYNAINRMLDFLGGLPDFDGIHLLRTADGKAIDQTLVDAAIKEATDLICSFESCFETTYGEDQRSVEEMLRQSWQVEADSQPTDPNKTPFLMPVFDPASMVEICAIKQAWPELKQRLEQSGTYSMLYGSI